MRLIYFLSLELKNMPRGFTKKRPKVDYLTLAFLLVKFFLIKTGSLPFSVIQTILAILATITHSLSKIRLPGFRIPVFRLQQRRERGRPKKFRLSRRFKIAAVFSVLIVFFAAYTVFLLTAAYELPTPTRLVSPDEPLTTEFYDRNGTLLYRLYEGRNRTLVKLSEIPKTLIEATVSIEDQNFYRHPGVDPLAIARAFSRNFKNGTLEGASTITQQLVKNSLLTPEKNYVRKIKEVILALWTERIYSKDDILQMYFNEAPYGGSLMGVAAAAQTYFGKAPRELNLAESSFLAGLPASPTTFSPYGTRPDLAKLRQKDVLARMVKDKYITEAQAEAAFAEDLNIKPFVNEIRAPHFVFYIRDLLAEKYGSRLVATGGLKIYTTLDLGLQEKVEEIVAAEIDGLKSLDVKNGAAMIVKTDSGQILSMVGSRDYHYPGFGNFNVTLALRQPGSSIKPVTYAAAFQSGFNPSNIILDTPVTFLNQWGSAYSPVNYDGKFHGPVSLRTALGSSLNIPAVKLLASVGLNPVIQTAKNLGITTFNEPSRYGLSLTLGSTEVKMIEMMGAYEAFARGGQFQPPTGILKVSDSHGNILEEYKNSPKQAISSQVAYLITNILSDDNARSLAFGPKSLLYIPGYEVGVKTGTSDNKRDNWTFGFSPKFVVGVWVGNPDNTPMNPQLASGITGAAPIWNKIMHTLLDGTTPLVFEKPGGIAESSIDSKKDLSQTGIIPKSLTRIQKNGDKFIFSDPFSSWATPSAQTVSLEYHPTP